MITIMLCNRVVLVLMCKLQILRDCRQLGLVGNQSVTIPYSLIWVMSRFMSEDLNGVNCWWQSDDIIPFGAMSVG